MPDQGRPTSRRPRVTLARGGAALAVTVHGFAHLAVYPLSGSVDPDVDPSRFWVPLSLARDASGWAARILLVVAVVGFLATGHQLAAGRRPTGWTVPAAGASLCSIAAVVVLWDDLHPRPEALWVGGVVSAVVLVAVVATLVGGHRAVEPGHTVEGPGVMRGTFDPAAPAEPGAPLGDTPRR